MVQMGSDYRCAMWEFCRRKNVAKHVNLWFDYFFREGWNLLCKTHKRGLNLNPGVCERNQSII